jgi:hypothetical protein
VLLATTAFTSKAASVPLEKVKKTKSSLFLTAFEAAAEEEAKRRENGRRKRRREGTMNKWTKWRIVMNEGIWLIGYDFFEMAAFGYEVGP